MPHTEQILVFRYTYAADGFGEFVPAAPELLSNAPMWATIDQTAGTDYIISERVATNYQFNIKVNWRDDFTWTRDMFIVSRFGAIDIDNIFERDRKRLIELGGVYIVGVDDTGSGSPSGAGGLTVLYYTVPSDSPTLNIPAIDGVEKVYLIFRDGNERTVVISSPGLGQVMVSGSDLSLMTGDIFFATERITILYV